MKDLLVKRNLITLSVVLILLLAIPLGLKLLQSQQILKSRAGAAPIAFQGVNVTNQNGKQVFRLDDQGKPTVGLILTSPFGEGSNIVQPASSAQGGSNLHGVICEVHSDKTSGVVPLTINFFVGAVYTNTAGIIGDEHLTNVQWDFNGDNNWDTPFDTASQRVSHTYNQPGNYTVKMHLQTFQGLTSGICTANITIGSTPLVTPNASGNFHSGQIGIAGRVFLDNDKDGFFSAGDQVITNTTVIIRKVGAIGDLLLPSGGTDQNGQYEIDLTNVPAGDYIVSATSESGLTGATSYHQNVVVLRSSVTPGLWDSFTIINIPIRPL